MGLGGQRIMKVFLATLHLYFEFIRCMLSLSVTYYALPLVSEFVYDPKPV